MIKRIAMALLVTMLLCTLSACWTTGMEPPTFPTKPIAPSTEGHIHTWQADNCDEKIVCAVCGSSDGAPTGHNWENATCIKPETCTICGRTMGNALGHHYENGACVRCKEDQKIPLPIVNKIIRYYIDSLYFNPITQDWRAHLGIDIAASIGTPVHAVTDGVVKSTYTDKSKGATVVIAHQGDYASVYCGLQSDFIVSQGESVSAGQVIGYVGNTNTSEAADAPHLHFEVTYKGETIDPLTYVQAEDHTQHEWQSATCTEAKTCSICGATEGEPLGHTYADGVCLRCGNAKDTPVEHIWLEATCTKAKTCSICGATEGEPLGHTYADGVCLRCGNAKDTPVEHIWLEATCTKAKTCSICGLTEGQAKGHDWQDATCTTPETCMNCQQTQGEASGHIWLSVTCHLLECDTCGATQEVEDGHNWKYETCTTMCCYSCGAIKAVAGEHIWSEANCLRPKTCIWCDETEGDLGEHEWEAATCTAPKTCAVCEMTEGEPGSHILTTVPAVAATCTAGGWTSGTQCEICHTVIESPRSTSALGHNWLPATYTSPKTCSRCGATTGGVAEKRPIEIEKPYLPYFSSSGYMVSLCSYSTFDNGDGTYNVEVALSLSNISNATFVGGVWCTLSGIEPDFGTAPTLAPGATTWCTVKFYNVPGGHYRIILG